jgi:HEAT repeat protein
MPELKRTAPRLLALLASRNDEERKGARSRVEGMGRAMLPWLMQASRAANENLRWEAVDLLGAIADPAAAPALLDRVLHDDDVHVRWRSIWAVTSADDGKTASALVKALKAKDARVRWNAAVALSVFARAEAIPILLSGLKSADPFQRWEAANGLGGYRANGVVKALTSSLTDPSTDVRREAALALGRSADPQAAGVLIGALEGDEDPQVRWRAALALTRLGPPGPLPQLRRLLKKERDGEVRRQIQETIAALRTTPDARRGSAANSHPAD